MAYLALYRAFRPRTFKEIAGQEHVTRTLCGALLSGRVGHAYLFCGPRGTGKTTAAKVLAKAVNCPQREGAEPCNRCESCSAVNEGHSLDVMEIDAASNRGIDEIRDLREKVNFMAAAGRRRVYIIDEVHMLTSEAFNALLKTLEEPPAHILFIMATTEPHRVPLTILSRCQRFDFKRIAVAEMVKKLKEVAAAAGIEAEEGAYALIARAAQGGLRDALCLLEQAAALGDGKVLTEDVRGLLGTVGDEALAVMASCIARSRAGDALRLVSQLDARGADMRLLARDLSSYLRALLLEKISPGFVSAEGWADPPGMAALAGEFDAGRLLAAAELLMAAEEEMKSSALPGLVLELALVKACRPELSAGLEGLAARVAALENELAGLKAGAGLKENAAKEAASNFAELPAKTAPDPPQPKVEAALPGSAAQRGAGGGIGLWEALLEEVRADRPALWPALKKCLSHQIKGQCLALTFPPGEILALETLSAAAEKKYIEGLLFKLTGVKWRLKTEIDSEKKAAGESCPRDDFEEAKKRFGGREVVLSGESNPFK